MQIVASFSVGEGSLLLQTHGLHLHCRQAVQVKHRARLPGFLSFSQKQNVQLHEEPKALFALLLLTIADGLRSSTCSSDDRCLLGILANVDNVSWFCMGDFRFGALDDVETEAIDCC